MSEIENLSGSDEFEDGEESPVIKELRNQLRTREKELSDLRKFREKVEADTQSRRADTAEQIVNTLGIPGLKEDVLNWVEGDITEQTVREVLEAKSIPLPVADGQQQETSTRQSAPVSEIAQRVADAAAGRDTRTLDERISQAESMSELSELMREAGLTQQHS